MDVYERLEDLQKVGIKLGLRNIHQLLEKLGSPEQEWPGILIAGTNGKGSVGAMLESILRRHGFATGHYTSPHLIELRERIRINGRLIEDAEFRGALQTVFEATDAGRSEGKLEYLPTFFETLTAAAFLEFARTRMEWGVTEVGLGGRFDATNALPQKISVITNIDFDHQEYLGHTLPEIAGEKAGILKPGIPLVTGLLPTDAAAVIQQEATRQSCPMSALTPEMILNLRLENGFPVFEFRPWATEVRVGLRGAHQASNAAIALLAADALMQSGVPMDSSRCAEALQDVRWPGRLDLIAEHPDILVDCAHNPNGVEALARYLEQSGCDKSVLMFTAMRDKNIAVMLSRIAARADCVFLTRVEPRDRCARYEELAGGCLTAKLPFIFKEDCATAFELAREDARSKNLPLVIFGSIYLIGEIFRLTNTPV